MKINKSISLKNRTRLLMMALSGSILLSSCGMANIDEPVEDKKIESTTEHTEQIINDAIDVIESDIRETEEELEEERNQVKEPVYFTYYIDLSSYTGDSLTEALKECGYENSFAFRKEIAKDLQMKRYAGTQVQNLAILAICGGTLTITDEDLISKVDALIEEILNNIGLGSEKEVKEKTKKVNNKEEVVEEITYKVVPVEPEKIPTTNWQSTAPVTNNPSNGNNNNDNNPSSDNNPSDDNDKKPNPPKPPVKHKHKFKETITYEANNDGKTHKVISTKECSCGKKEVKVISEKEQCKEGQPKKEGNFNCYYCEHCHQLLRKVQIAEEHNHNYTEYVGSTYKDNETHTSTYKCSCGETTTKDEGCTKTTKEEGNYKITYCSKCGHEFERKLIEEEHKHNYTGTGSFKYQGSSKHAELLRCSCGNEIYGNSVGCTSDGGKKEGDEMVFHCTICGGELGRETIVHNHDWSSEQKSGCKVYKKCSSCPEVDYNSVIRTEHGSYVESTNDIDACHSRVDTVCGDCGETISTGEVSTHHNYGEVEASDNEEYLYMQVCSGCGDKKYSTPRPEDGGPSRDDEEDVPSRDDEEAMLETLNTIRYSLIKLKEEYLCNYSFNLSNGYMLIKRIK